MNELLAVFGVDRPSWLLGRAVAADTTLAAPWLVDLVDRIATEGRPTLRRSWREEVKRIADLHHLAVAIGDEELTVGDETPPRTSTEAVTTDEAEPDDEASLVRLETREADDYIGIEPARALLDRYEHLDEGQRARLAACLAGTEEEAGVRVAEARLAIAASDDEAAWKAGVAAIETSRSGDWSRHWAGGPILELLPELRRIEADLLAPVMYRRIAEHGSSNDHFLNNLGVELDRCVGPLGLPAEAAAASALEVAAAVVGNLADLPDPASLRLATEERTAEPGAFEQAIDDLIGWLLRSDHMIAWQAAQRAILALLDSEPESAERILRAVLTEGETDACMRACAVIETAAVRDRALALADELAPLTASSSLALRVAAEMALHALSAAVPAPPAARPLPAGLALELQPADSREIASGLVAEVREHRRAIRALARAAGVDRAALHQHVVRRSLAMGEQPVASGKHSIRGIFGYGYLRPSVKTVRRALDETAAQLVDARRADPAGALLAAELWPPYDSGLLVTRPGRRPAEVVAFLSADGRRDNDLYKTPVEDLAAGAQKRIATRIDGWTVLGESTDLRLLNRYGHYEFRENGVVLTGWEDSGDTGLSSLRACPSNAYDRESGDAELEATTVIRTAGGQIASPSGWLALDPVIALALALRRDESRLFGWTLDGEPAVHSVWWRSGYCCWQPYSDADEVGEGWLVVASPAFMAALRAYGGLARAGRVTTGRRGSSESPADETETDIGGYV